MESSREAVQSCWGVKAVTTSSPHGCSQAGTWTPSPAPLWWQDGLLSNIPLEPTWSVTETPERIFHAISGEGKRPRTRRDICIWMLLVSRVVKAPWSAKLVILDGSLGTDLLHFWIRAFLSLMPARHSLETLVVGAWSAGAPSQHADPCQGQRRGHRRAPQSPDTDLFSTICVLHDWETWPSTFRKLKEAGNQKDFT